MSLELLCVAVVAMFGLVTAFTSVRDATISELSDVAGSVQDVTQCYAFNQVDGHSSVTHGSSFLDATDHCDLPDDVAGETDNCIVFTEPEDEVQPPAPVTYSFEGEGRDVTATVGGPYSDGWIVWSNGQISVDVDIPEDGLYKFSSRLFGSRGGPDLPNAALNVDGTTIQDFDIVPTSHATAEHYCVEVFLTVGSHNFAVEFTNDFYRPPIDRNLFVDSISVTGPN